MIQEETFRTRALTIRRAARANLIEMRRARLARQAGVVVANTQKAEEAGHEAADMLFSDYETALEPETSAELITDDGNTEATRGRDSTDITVLTVPIEVTDAVVEGAVSQWADTEPPPTTVTAVPMQKPKRRLSVKAKPYKKPKAVMISDLDDFSVLAAAMGEIEEESQAEVSNIAKMEAAPDRDVKADTPTDLQPNLPEDTPIVAMAEVLPCAAKATSVEPTDSLYALHGAGPGLIWMLNQVGIASMGDLATADAEDLSKKLGLVGQILNVGSWVEFARCKQCPR